MMPAFELLQGDCLQQLATLPAASVQCCVTSPPYWGLRDYGTAKWEGGDAECDHKDPFMIAERARNRKGLAKNASEQDGADRSLLVQNGLDKAFQYVDTCGKCGAKRVDVQLGLEATPDEYVANMVAVFSEVRRVLRDDGTLWLNLGDSYHGSYIAQSRVDGRSDTLNAANPAMAHKDTRHNLGVLKPKDLCGIPWRVAFALQADGWYLRQDIIWHKPNPMPESVTDRCTKAHEYIFLLTKSARYYYDNEAVKEESFTTVNRKTLETDEYKNGKTPSEVVGRAVQRGGKSLAYAYPNGIPFRNKRSVWTVTTKPFKGAHFATFPPDLIEPCILAGTSKNGQCPKCGKSWKRIMEKIGVSTYEKMGGKNGGYKKMREESMRRGETGVGDTRDSNGNIVWYEATPKKFVGWQPDCVCGLDPIASVVLDPFSGAGTTGVVAVQHGRRYIGIELNPDYLEMSRKRIQLVRDSLTVPMFADA